MVGSGRVCRDSKGAVFLVGVVCLLVVGIINHQTGQMTMTTVVTSARRIEDLKSIGKLRNHGVLHYDLNFVSKRRVPNGPDPIHNRRAGKSTQPPDRS
ncbi:CLAVATA3/ESR (CLE)-related protein 25-like [Apium graveolens]|uniref:CLAVATA3/ESR (CLE)-related protein 25-like n=1 Tax=Apium graveolens TaxID=4045 RepID=UPI003D78DEF0